MKWDVNRDKEVQGKSIKETLKEKKKKRKDKNCNFRFIFRSQPFIISNITCRYCIKSCTSMRSTYDSYPRN